MSAAVRNRARKRTRNPEEFSVAESRLGSGASALAQKLLQVVAASFSGGKAFTARELATESGASETSVRKAIAELKRRGFVHTVGHELTNLGRKGALKFVGTLVGEERAQADRDNAATLEGEDLAEAEIRRREALADFLGNSRARPGEGPTYRPVLRRLESAGHKLPKITAKRIRGAGYRVCNPKGSGMPKKKHAKKRHPKKHAAKKRAAKTAKKHRAQKHANACKSVTRGNPGFGKLVRRAEHRFGAARKNRDRKARHEVEREAMALIKKISRSLDSISSVNRAAGGTAAGKHEIAQHKAWLKRLHSVMDKANAGGPCDACGRYGNRPGEVFCESCKAKAKTRRVNPTTLADGAEAWARSRGMKVPARGSAAWKGLFTAWQRSVAHSNPKKSSRSYRAGKAVRHGVSATARAAKNFWAGLVSKENPQTPQETALCLVAKHGKRGALALARRQEKHARTHGWKSEVKRWRKVAHGVRRIRLGAAAATKKTRRKGNPLSGVVAALNPLARKPLGHKCKWKDAPAAVKRDPLARKAVILAARRHGIPMDEVVGEVCEGPAGVARHTTSSGEIVAFSYKTPEGTQHARTSRGARIVFDHKAGDHGRGKKASKPCLLVTDPKTGHPILVSRRGSRPGFSSRRGHTG